MSASRPARTIALLSSPGTLEGIDLLLERAGVRLVRIPTVEPVPTDPGLWRPRVTRAPAVDTVVVTSRAGVTAGVEPWLKTLPPGPQPCEFWAVGPGTARALRTVGVRRLRRPRTVGALALARELGRETRRTVLYFRSHRAGPGLARSLRSQGHRVLDVVVYRLEPTRTLTAQARRDLAIADLWIATSPSTLATLRESLDRQALSKLCRVAHLVVLGERSRRAASALGFEHVSVAPTTAAQAFTQHLLRELRNVGP